MSSFVQVPASPSSILRRRQPDPPITLAVDSANVPSTGDSATDDDDTQRAPSSDGARYAQQLAAFQLPLTNTATAASAANDNNNNNGNSRGNNAHTSGGGGAAHASQQQQRGYTTTRNNSSSNNNSYNEHSHHSADGGGGGGGSGSFAAGRGGFAASGMNDSDRQPHSRRADGYDAGGGNASSATTSSPFHVLPPTPLENRWDVSGTVASQALLDTVARTAGSFAATKRQGRATRMVFEDLFHTYTGFPSVGAFMEYQASGARLHAALRAGADFKHEAVRPQLPPELLETLAAVKSTHAGAAALKNRSLAAAAAATTTRTQPFNLSFEGAAARGGGRDGGRRALAPPQAQQRRSGKQKQRQQTIRSSSDSGSVGASASSSPAAAPTAAGDEDGGSGGEESEEGEEVGAGDADTVGLLLPPMSELPPPERADAAAVEALRAKVNTYHLRLSRMVDAARQMDGRWGGLQTAERHALLEAMALERAARLRERDLFDCFTTLRFAHQYVGRVTEEVAACRRVTCLVVNDCPALTAVEALPPACRTASFAGCSITRVAPAAAASAPGLVVLGLAYNCLEELGFISQMPSLRVLDVTANRVHDLAAATAALAAHPALEEVRLLGNPVALLDDYFGAVARACPGVASLDGHLFTIEERRAPTEAEATAARDALVSYYVVSGRAAGARPAAASSPLPENAGGRAGGASSSSPSPSTAATTAAAKKKKAAAAREELSLSAADREAVERHLRVTVGARVQLLALRGAAGLAHTPPAVASWADLSPASALLLRASEMDLSGDAAGGEDAGLEALKRLVAERAGGSSSHSVGSLSGRKTGGGGGGGGGGGKAGAGLPAVPLYECSTYVTLEARWGAPEEDELAASAGGADEGGEADDGRQPAAGGGEGAAGAQVTPGLLRPPAACVHVLVEDYPLDGAPTSGGAAAPLAGAPSLGGGGGARRSSAGGAGRATARLRKALAAATAAVVEDVLRPAPSAFAADLGVRGDLAACLRRPLHVRLRLRDEVRYYDEASLAVLLDGAPPGAAPPAAAAASSSSGGGGRSSAAASSAASAAGDDEDQCETRTLDLGGFWIATGELLRQDHSRTAPPPPPAAATGGRRRASSVNAGGGARDKDREKEREAAAAAAVEEGLPGLPCHRQLNARGCALAPAAGSLAAERHRLTRLQASLRAALCAAADAQYTLALEEQAAAARQLTRRHSSAAGALGGATPGSSPGRGRERGAGGGGGRDAGRDKGAQGSSSSSAAAAASAALLHAREAAAVARRAVTLLAARVLGLQQRLEELRAAAPTLDVRLALGRGPPPPLEPAEAELQGQERALAAPKGKKGAKKK